MINWLYFIVVSFALTVSLYLPGLISFSKFDIPNHLLVALSPIFSLMALFLAMLLSYVAQISVPWYWYVLLLVMLSFVFAIKNRRCLLRRINNVSATSFCVFVVYMLVSLILVAWIYLKNLDGPSSVIPYFDNAFALSTVRSFSNTKLYGVLFSSCYRDSSVLFNGASYYPTGMHSIAALLVEIFSISPSEALNIIIFVSLCPILCLSVRSLISSCYPEDNVAQLSGCVVSYFFVAFPWGLITFGSLLANLFSLVFVPAAISSAIILSDRLVNRKGSISHAAIAFILALILLAFTHPGSLFTAGVVIAPLIVKSVYTCSKCSGKQKSWPSHLFVACIAILAVVTLWAICYYLPPLHATVSFNWPAFQSFGTAVSSIFTLSFFDFPAQLPVCLLVQFGLISCFRRKDQNNWLIASAIFAGILYIVDVSTDGYLKQLLTGFWYTDSRRIAAIVVISLIPFAARGISLLFRHLYHYAASKPDTGISPRVYSVLWILLLLGFAFGPSLVVNGSFTLSSAFSYLRCTLSSINELNGKPFVNGAVETLMLDKDELSAGSEIADMLDQQYVTLNNPLDGSSFFYGLYNVNLLYRQSSAQDSSDPYALLRKRIHEYTSNRAVKQEVLDKHIRYVLQLDSGVSPSDSSSFYCIYDPNFWSGIQSIDANTPGFKLIYSKDDIRLYELTDIY